MVHGIEHECGRICDLHPVLIAEALDKEYGPLTDGLFDVVLPVEGHCLVGSNFDHLSTGVGRCRCAYQYCSQSGVLVFRYCSASTMISLCGFKFGEGGWKRSHRLDALQMILILSPWVPEVNSDSGDNGDGCNGCNNGKDSDGREEAGGNNYGGETSYSKIRTIYFHPSQYRNTADLDKTETTVLMRDRMLDIRSRNYVEVRLWLRVFSFEI